MMSDYLERTYYTMTDCGIDRETLKQLCKEPDSITTSGFLDLFLMEYDENWIIYEDQILLPWEESQELVPTADKINLWKNHFKYRFATSFERYEKLLNLYTTEKDNLLNKVERATKSVYNDTPQDKENTITDGFNTTITTHSTAADPDELINRLKNIENNYADIYGDWIKEFRPLFGEAI